MVVASFSDVQNYQSMNEIDLSQYLFQSITLPQFNVAIEHGPVEIVDIFMKNGGSFYTYVAVYQRINHH